MIAAEPRCISSRRALFRPMFLVTPHRTRLSSCETHPRRSPCSGCGSTSTTRSHRSGGASTSSAMSPSTSSTVSFRRRWGGPTATCTCSSPAPRSCCTAVRSPHRLRRRGGRGGHPRGRRPPRPGRPRQGRPALPRLRLRGRLGPHDHGRVGPASHWGRRARDVCRRPERLPARGRGRHPHLQQPRRRAARQAPRGRRSGRGPDLAPTGLRPRPVRRRRDHHDAHHAPARAPGRGGAPRGRPAHPGEGRRRPRQPRPARRPRVRRTRVARRARRAGPTRPGPRRASHAALEAPPRRGARERHTADRRRPSQAHASRAALHRAGHGPALDRQGQPRGPHPSRRRAAAVDPADGPAAEVQRAGSCSPAADGRPRTATSSCGMPSPPPSRRTRTRRNGTRARCS